MTNSQRKIIAAPDQSMEKLELDAHAVGKAKTRLGTTKFEGRGVSAHRVDITAGAGFDYAWKGAAHYLAFHELALEEGEIYQDGAAPIQTRNLNGLLTFVPAEARVWGWSVPRKGNHSFTALYLDPTALEDELARRLAALPDRIHLYFKHPLLQATLAKLHQSFSGTSACDALYQETLCLVSVLELGQITRGNEALGAGMSTQLGPRQFDLICDYIESNLAENIALSDLAQLVDISRFHFLRLFRGAAGETPYQYLIRRRIEKAKVLLQLKHDASMDVIAQQVGFSSVSRFGAAFRRHVGQTPSAFRKNGRRS